MNVSAIIAEYNPCHKGHAYHIRKTREMTEAECIVVIMSGNYVQRGIPAMFDKYTRAHAAILAGADLVIELPVIYATASAEFFAENAVKIINKLGNVNTLTFGVEQDDLSVLSKIADILIDEPDEFKDTLKFFMKNGESVATARTKALCRYIPDADRIVASPNNILAIEYIKAIKRYCVNIDAVGIKRIGNGYNDELPTTKYPSATAIRKMYDNGNDTDIRSAVPSEIYEYFRGENNISADDFNSILNCSLLHNKGCYNSFLDVDDRLANRIEKNMRNGKFYGFSELAMQLKTKNYTFTRICRILTHIMLEIRKNDIIEPEYSRVLAFNNTGSKYIKELKKSDNNILFTDINSIKNILSENAIRSLEKDIYASDLYRMVMYEKNGILIPDEFRHKPEIV